MKNILCLLAVVSLTFTSCKEEEAKNVTVSKEVSPFSDDFKGPEAPAVTSPPPTPTPGMAPIGTPTSASTQAPVAVAKGMNPAHGQPGHRCDIAVGAPLNSPPGKAPAGQSKPATTISSANTASGTVSSNGATITTVNNNAPAATPTVTAPGMNPPHGQEGHVCSVAVGAPLPKSE